jgi:hypothetical protein
MRFSPRLAACRKMMSSKEQAVPYLISVVVLCFLGPTLQAIEIVYFGCKLNVLNVLLTINACYVKDQKGVLYYCTIS